MLDAEAPISLVIAVLRAGEWRALFRSREDEEEPKTLDLVRRCSELEPAWERGYTGAEGCLRREVTLGCFLSDQELEES